MDGSQLKMKNKNILPIIIMWSIFISALIVAYFEGKP